MRLPLGIQNEFTLERCIANQVFHSEPSYIPKMKRFQKEFKMIQKQGKSRLKKTYSSIIKTHSCSITIPKFARDYVKYSKFDMQRLNEKEFRKKFSMNQTMMSLEKKQRSMKIESENQILKNYKRWDKRKKFIEQENREK